MEHWRERNLSARRNGTAVDLIGIPAPTGSVAPAAEPGRRFGVGTASALVVGSVIGTGVFALPFALAVFGPISLVAFVLVTIGTSWLGAISAAGAIDLFSYLGIESASVAAGRVRDPERNVGRATVLGTLACAVVYLLGTVTVFGTVAHDNLVGSTAPFSDSADAIFGGQWAGATVAVAAVVAGFGALVGWTLTVAEMPRAAARDGLFPQRFAGQSRAGVPAFGIVVSTLLASGLTVVSYTSFEQVFVTVVLLSVFTAVIPYLFSSAVPVYVWIKVRRGVYGVEVVR